MTKSIVEESCVLCGHSANDRSRHDEHGHKPVGVKERIDAPTKPLNNVMRSRPESTS